MFYLINSAFKSRSVFTVWFLASRSLKLDPMFIGFDELFFHEKMGERTRRKNRGTRDRKNRKQFFFPFRKAWIVPLAKTKPCLLRKKERGENVFFSLQTVHLAKKRAESAFFSFREVRASLSRKQNRASRKKTENTFFFFPRGTGVPLAIAKPCLWWIQNRASHRKRKRKHVFCAIVFLNFVFPSKSLERWVKN